MRLGKAGWAWAVAVGAFLSLPVFASGSVEGSFKVGGKDAGLKLARAAKVELEKGKPGYALLLSARPAEGPIESWRTAEPADRGSFIVVLFEEKGGVWVAELGHAAAKSGRFGVVTELAADGFVVKGEKVSAHLTTYGDQSFGDDTYSVDLRFEAPLE